jgi:hypothetical protein
MSMNANDMKDAIISEMNQEAGSAANANKKLGDAVLAYICDNMDITYGWSATNPSTGAPDPVASFEASISGSGTLPISGSFPLFIVTLAGLIKSALTISPEIGFSLSPLAFNPAGVITVTLNNEDTQETAMQSFCEQFIDSLKSSFPNPSPASGSHAAYVGLTTKMVIA